MNNAQARTLLLGSFLIAIALYLIIALVTTLPAFENPGGYYPERTDGLEIAVDFAPPVLKLGGGGSTALKGMWYTQLQPGDGALPERVCLDELVIYNAESTPYLGVSYFGEGFPVCYDLELIDAPEDPSNPMRTFDIQSSELPNQTPIELPTGRDSFRYPYDRFQYMFAYQVSYRVLYADGTSEAHTGELPAVSVFFPETTEWDIDVEAESISNTVLGLTSWVPDGKLTIIELRRPLLSRIMFAVIVAGILLFILLLCFIDSHEAFIEGAVGVFFGIFGLNQFLLPPIAEVRTLVQFATWGLYVALTGVTVAHIYLAIKEMSRNRRPGSVEPQQQDERTGAPSGQVPGVPDLPRENQKRKPALIALIGVVSLAIWMFAQRLRSK